MAQRLALHTRGGAAQDERHEVAQGRDQDVLTRLIKGHGDHSAHRSARGPVEQSQAVS